MKSAGILALLAFPLMLAGCAKSDEENIKELLMKHSNLIDPSSVMLRNILKKPGKNSYCVEMNSKNRLGAYTGWEKATVFLGDANKLYLYFQDSRHNRTSGADSESAQKLAQIVFKANCPGY